MTASAERILHTKKPQNNNPKPKPNQPTKQTDKEENEQKPFQKRRQNRHFQTNKKRVII